MTDFESFAAEFGNQAEIDALAARGGHDEDTVLTLFRRLRGGPNQVRGGDTGSMRDHLVMVHAPLVEHCARSFLASGEPLDDLVQEGYVGLIKAVDRYDPDKGIKFSTYACHLISGEIRHYLRDLGRLIHEPGWHFELRQRIARTSDSLTQQTGRLPTPEEIAAHLSVKVETVREVQSRSQTLNVESLDAKDAQDEGEGRLSLLERHEAEPGGLGRGEAGRVEDQLFIEAALPQLKELEQQAVRLFFFEELTKTEIARSLGISVNYVSYLVKRGTEALRRILEATEPLPAVHSTASVLSQQQARAAFLLQLAKSSRETDPRRAFKPQNRVPALTKPGVMAFPQFAAWMDDEVARVGRYGGEFAVVWFQIRNWIPITKNLSVADKRAATAGAATLVRRLCRGVDKVAAMQSADPPGLHFFVLMPVTGTSGEIVGNRLTQAFSKPDLPGITAPLHTRMAFAACPENGRIGDELFVYLGEMLAAGD